MLLTFTGKNIEITEDLKNMAEKKLGRLDKYFAGDTEARVTMGLEKGTHTVEVTIPVKGDIIRTEQSSGDMYSSIDLAREAIERQLLKHKNKIVDRYQSGLAQEYIDETYDEDEDAIRIVKTKRFAVKPMDAEEACLQMEMLGHSFYVFRDAESDEVCVVYKRKDGAYGLIEPEY